MCNTCIGEVMTGQCCPCRSCVEQKLSQRLQQHVRVNPGEWEVHASMCVLAETMYSIIVDAPAVLPSMGGPGANISLIYNETEGHAMRIV